MKHLSSVATTVSRALHRSSVPRRNPSATTRACYASPTAASSSTAASSTTPTPTTTLTTPNQDTTLLPGMMGTIDPHVPLQQAAYMLELPFAVLDVRHGVWADIIAEVERNNSVKIGRLKNQFQKTTLTVHASDETLFAAASKALQEAHTRVFEYKVPIPDPESKLRIIGKNGARMDSVSRKYGVNIRYNSPESMAYVQGRSKQEVSAAGLRLSAYEKQVELTHKQNCHLRSNDSAIDAIERKWKVQISSLPNINWKPPTLLNVPKTAPSLYGVVGAKENVIGAETDMAGVANRQTVDLSPWLVHKDIIIPAKRKEIVLGPDKKRFEHWK
jgi:hypothetical protein